LPIQRLELVDRLFRPLFTGEKRSTLRWRKEKKVGEGFLVYEASKNPRWHVLVWVTKISSGPLSSFASAYDMTPEQLLASMRTHYPNIEMNSDVDLVEHLSPQETLRLHGVPEEVRGKVLQTAEDLEACALNSF